MTRNETYVLHRDVICFLCELLKDVYPFCTGALQFAVSGLSEIWLFKKSCSHHLADLTAHQWMQTCTLKPSGV